LNRPLSVIAIACVASALCLALIAHAQQPRPRRSFSIVSLAELPRIIDPQLSPDGRFAIYMLNRADWKTTRPVPHIWRQAVAGGPPTQITNTEAGENTARWSPDGQSILFSSRGQLFVMPAGGGDAKQVTRHATGVSAAAWSPDGTAIYFLATDPQMADERERARLQDDVFAFEENLKSRHLWRVDVSSGAEQKITDGNYSITAFRLSQDGRRLAVHRAPTTLTADNRNSEVWVMDASGANARQITNNTVEESGPEPVAELSPDNTQVLFLAEANARFDPYYAASLFIAPAAGGAARLLLPDFQYDIERATWAPDGSILAVVNMGVHSEIFRIDVAARRARPLTDGRHAVLFWSVVPSAKRMIFQLDEPTRLGDAWTLPLDGGTPTRVTAIYDTLEHDFNLPRQEKVTWKGADGATIEGLLFYPIDYEPGRRYPLVVQLHGGPADSDKFGYGTNVVVNYVPVLAAKGYAVLRPNYRGSNGYGSDFRRDVVGHYFRNQHLDVMAGIDALVQQGIADPDRLAVSGWSAGGHLANKLITFTDRFKAASSAAGIANMISLFAQSDARTSRTNWFGSLPWVPNAPIDQFWDDSPIKDASKAKTPTIFFAGENDPRVPLPQSVEMFRALKANNVTTRLYVAPREPHQWFELRHQLSKANAELEWFEKYVMGRNYTWERAPD